MKLQASDCNFAQKELYGRYFTVSLAKTEQVLRITFSLCGSPLSPVSAENISIQKVSLATVQRRNIRRIFGKS